MGELATLFLLFVVALTVLARLGLVWMGRKAGRSTRVTGRFEEAQYIIDTGRVPENWLAQTARLEAPSRRTKLLARFDRLVEFFRTSPVVADRPTRELLLDKLRKTRKQWQHMPL